MLAWNYLGSYCGISGDICISRDVNSFLKFIFSKSDKYDKMLICNCLKEDGIIYNDKVYSTRSMIITRY